MEKIIADLAEMLARAERVKANAERRYLEACGADELESLESDLNWYACGYADAMRYALQAIKDYQDVNGVTYDIERRRWVG